MKFKLCCEGRQDVIQEARRSPWMIGGLAVVGLGAVATVLVLSSESAPTPVSRSLPPPAPPSAPIINGMTSSGPITMEPVPPGTPVPQPPGPTPEGKVWSPEHRHFHDLPGAVTQGSNAANGAIPITAQPGSPGTNTPQPEGPTPEGKVWSPEHGHYHDLPGAVVQGAPGAPGANGALPPGPQPADPSVITPQPVVPPAPPAGTPAPK